MEEKKSRSQVVTILKALSRNRMAVLGLVILIILLFTGIFAHVIAPYDFAKQNLADAFQHPSPSHIFEQMSSAATSSAVLCTGPECLFWSALSLLALL